MVSTTATIYALGLLATFFPAVSGQTELHHTIPMSPIMAKIHQQKLSIWHIQDVSGISKQTSTDQSYSACIDGLAAGIYPCKNLDLAGYLSNTDAGSNFTWASDVWGWTSPEGREIAILGQFDGTAFIEVLSDGTLKYLGRLPATAAGSEWRSIKVIDGYAYIGTEAELSGVQIFDLRKVLKLKRPKTFTNADQTGHYTGCSSSHNVVDGSDGCRKILYVVGSRDVCSGGLVAVNVTDPANPVTAGCFSADGYTHDAQCVMYKGPDTRYRGHPICLGFNEDTLTITDHSDEANITMISRTGYPEAAYTHQGWFMDEKQTLILMDDEYDEINKTSSDLSTPTTYVWNAMDLQMPFIQSTYNHAVPSIDHNLYIKDGYSYHSNYASGLRVVDIKGLAKGLAPKEVAYFDVYPESNDVTFVGTWSNYPFFKSGYIIVSSMERGIFSLKRTEE